MLLLLFICHLGIASFGSTLKELFKIDLVDWSIWIQAVGLVGSELSYVTIPWVIIPN